MCVVHSNLNLNFLDSISKPKNKILISIWNMVPYKRDIKFFFQKRLKGFSDDETWNLDSEISKFVLPRLKRFKELNICHPGNLTPTKWDQMIDDMIFYHECILDEEKLVLTFESCGRFGQDAFTMLMISKREKDRYSKEEIEAAKALVQRYKRGKRYFHNYYESLWW
jgi:hypothetical protein